jgi:hypothetical protein
VYRAVKKTTGEVAAAKGIRCPLTADLEEFGVEVLLLTKHKHTQLVQFFEGFYHKKILWLMLELAVGQLKASQSSSSIPLAKECRWLTYCI